MNRQAYILSAARQNASSEMGFKHNDGLQNNLFLVLQAFVKALVGKPARNGAAADMLIFNTLLVEVSSEPAVSPFEICYLI
jgi:hypothetical protein